MSSLRIQVVAEVFFVAAAVEGDALGDAPVLDQLGQALVHGLHAELTPRSASASRSGGSSLRMRLRMAEVHTITSEHGSGPCRRR